MISGTGCLLETRHTEFWVLRMEKIALLSNQTRAAQRPPLYISLARSALFAELVRKYPKKVVRKPSRSPRMSHGQPGLVKPAAQARPAPAASQPPPEKPAPVKPVEPSPRDLSFRRPQNGRPAAGGSNGHSSTSQIFRSSSITSTPSIRQPARPALPVQIPFEAHTPYRNGRDQEPAPKPADSTTEESRPQTPAPVEPAPLPPIQPKATPSMASFLRQHPELPAQTALLGICEDGLPVLLDLFDPAPGALIVIGDEREKQLELLRSAVASMVKRNSPRSVQFIVITCDSQAWQQWVAKHGFERHCLGIEDAEGELVREWVLRLADWTEQRRLGQRSGPPVLLVMDTLSFLPRMSYDVRLNFEWMVREGPQAQIWPLGAISTELARMLHSRRMLRAFQTRILGCAENPAVYTDLAGLPQASVGDFREPGQFAVQVGENWLRFRLFGSQ